MEVQKLGIYKLEKLNVDELKPVPTDLSKVSDEIKYILKRLNMINWLKKLKVH